MTTPADSPTSAPSTMDPRNTYAARRRRNALKIALLIIVTFLGLFGSAAVLFLRGFDLAFVDPAKFPYMDPKATLPGASIIPPQNLTAEPKSFSESVAKHTATNPADAEGLAKLKAALYPFDSLVNNTSTSEQLRTYLYSEEFREFSRETTNTVPRGVRDALAATTTALASAIAAGSGPHFNLPPYQSHRSVVPNFLATQTLIRTLAAQARVTAFDGDPNLAARQALAAIGLGNVFCAKDTGLISHLIGFACMSIGNRALSDILRDERITSDTAAHVADTLRRFDAERAPLSEAARTEGRTHITGIRAYRQNPRQMLADTGEANSGNTNFVQALALKAYFSTIGSQTRFEKDCDRFFRLFAEEFKQPLTPEHLAKLSQFMHSDKGVTRYLRLHFAMPNWIEAYVRSEVARTIRDPFTDKPLLETTTTIYSLGPDHTDNNATLRYDPTNGTVSTGDIFLIR